LIREKYRYAVWPTVSKLINSLSGSRMLGYASKGSERSVANPTARLDRLFRKEHLYPVDLTIRDLPTLSTGMPPS
jgi:hypothetical protein